MKRYSSLSIIGLMTLFEVGVLITALFCLIGCGRGNDATKASKIIPVKLQVVGLSDEANYRNYVGTAEESFALSVSFQTGGTVERILVSEGQRVAKGQLLAEVSSPMTQNNYNSAKASLKQAEDAYARLSELYQKGSLTDIKFVEIETSLEQAKANEAISRKNLEDCKIYALFSGIISTRSIEKGQDVMTGESAFKMVSIDEIDVKVSIPENEISAIRTGQAATVTVSALGNKQYTGVVDKKGVEANSISHTYDIKIRIKNPQSELMPGMVCKAFLHDGAVSNKIVIPNKAVMSMPEGERFVWLEDNMVARRRFITIGPLTDYGVTVETGLSEGDKVITEGYNKISEGMQISVIQ